MVTIQSGYKKCLTSFYLGRKCIYCESRKVCITKRNYIKCEVCLRSKSLRRLRFELDILVWFVYQRPAYQVAIEYGVSYRKVTRVYETMRKMIYHQCELEGRDFSGEIEMDEAYFGGRKKGVAIRGRKAGSKSIVFGLLERKGKVYTKVVVDVTAFTLMRIIREKTKKGSVYYTDNFKSYNSLSQYGTHRRVNHTKEYVSVRMKNHINGLEGFWSYAKHKLYNYRGVSKANFPLYLKEMEFRYNHRKENLLSVLKDLYFSYETY